MFSKIKNSIMTYAGKASKELAHFLEWFNSLKAVRFAYHIIDKPLALNESYTYKLFTFLYSGVACVHPSEQIFNLCRRGAQVMLFTVALSAPFLSGVVLFCMVQTMFILFMAMLITAKENQAELSDFDILLLLFCLTILTVASVGKPISGMLSAWLVFGSFIVMYVAVINLVRDEELLFHLKLVFCIAGALVSALQLIGNIFSFEMRVLGQLYVLCIPMAVELFFYAKDRRLKFALAGMSAVMFLALIVVWSGGGWAWATFILAFFLVIRDWRMLTIGGICLLFLPMITPFKIIDFDSLTHQGIIEYIMGPSKDYRMSAIEAVGGFLDYYRVNSMEGYWYASLLVLICIAVLLILLIKEIFSHVKIGKTGMICAILAAVGSGVTGFLYQDISTGIFNNYSTLLIFWLFISIYAAQSRIEEGAEGKSKYTAVKKIAGRLSFIDIIPVILTVSVVLAALKF